MTFDADSLNSDFQTSTPRGFLQTPASSAAEGLIRLYRKQGLFRNSVRKLARVDAPCANGVMGMGPTCSAKGLELVTTLPLREAFAQQRGYMKQCGEMAQIFHIAVMNDTPAAVQQITTTFGRTEEEAAKFVVKAQQHVADKEGIEEYRERHKNKKHSRPDSRDCVDGCDPTPFYIWHIFGDCGRGGARGSSNSCDVGDIGKCDGGGKGCDLDLGGCDGCGPS